MRRTGLALALSCVFLAPAAHAFDGSSIIITKTVGLGPDCADTNDITVPAGSFVTYCYQVQNTGVTTLTTHTLVDDVLGTLIGPESNFNLNPGEVFTTTQTTGPINQKVKNTATWTALTNVVTWGTEVATATAMATVTVSEDTNQACGDRIDNDLDTLIDCADPNCTGVAICGAAAPVMGSLGMLVLSIALLVGGTLGLSARKRAS